MDESQLYRELLKPYPQLQEWSESLKAYLDSYLRRIHGEGLTDFVQAALLVCNSTKLYSKKVDILHKIVQEFLDDLLKSNNRLLSATCAGPSTSGARKIYQSFENDALEPLDFVVSKTPVRIPRNAIRKVQGSIKQVYPQAPILKRSNPDLSIPMVALDGIDIGKKEEFGLFQRDMFIQSDIESGPVICQLVEPFQHSTACDIPPETDSLFFRNGNQSIAVPGDATIAATVVELEETLPRPSTTMTIPGPKDQWAPMQASEKFASLNKPVELKCSIYVPRALLNHPRLESFRAQVSTMFELKTRKIKESDGGYSWVNNLMKDMYLFADVNDKRVEMRRKTKIFRRAPTPLPLPAVVEDSLVPHEPHDPPIDALSAHLPQADFYNENNNQEGNLNFLTNWSPIAMEVYQLKRKETNLTAWELDQRVQKWHATISPRLKKDQERQAFDPKVYGHHIQDVLEAGEGTLAFHEVMRRLHDRRGGVDKAEVCRYFFSALFLASTSNIGLETSECDPPNMSSLKLRLLSREEILTPEVMDIEEETSQERAEPSENQ